MKPQRLFDILTYRKQTTPQRAVWAVRKGNEWVKIYVDQYIDYVDYVSGFLLYKGLKPGGEVALISGNRPEWNYVDMGVQQVGGIVVPIYPTISESDYRYVLSNSEVSYLVVETELLLGKLKDIIIQQPTLQMVCVINPIKFDSPVVSELQASGREVVQFSDWIRLGQQEVDRDAISQRMQVIAPDDVATIIYTSGSTGVPKGVMLTHTNILTCIYGVSSIPPSHYERAMSFLPLCHVYERMMNYFYQYMGYETYYAENVGKVVENMNTAKPHIMTAVPRFVEKMYDGIYRKGERLKGLRKKIFYWSLSLGTKYRLEGNTLWYRMRRNWADILVYRQIRESFGGCLEMLVTGGSAIQPRLARFFTCVGMAIYEGYGLSETSPVISVSSSGIWGREWGTAGPPLSGIEVRIDDETGEILCRGSNVMKGYYKSPDLTSQVIDSDGWFHTGDTGAFTEHGCLRITGRTKTMFKTSMGKFVNPEVIESKFKESPFILDMMVVGENQKFAAAVIVPDFDFLKDWQSRHGITCRSRDEMVTEAKTLARYQRVVDKYNKCFGATEQIKRWCVLNDVWDVQNGCLTPTLKIKRAVISERCQTEIQKLFK